MSTDEGLTPEENPTDDGNVVEEDKNAKLRGLSVDELVDHVLELRQENAKHRTDKKAATTELEEFRAWKESQKTDLERLQDENARLKKETEGFLQEALIRKAGKSAELDEELWEFIKGSTEDEMMESAKKLAEKAGKKKEADDGPPASQATSDGGEFLALLGGRRGTPIEPKKTSGGAFLEGLAK